MKPTVDSHLSRLGYQWVKVSPNEVAETLSKSGAICYQLDVYASNDKVYRTTHIDIPQPMGNSNELEFSVSV